MRSQCFRNQHLFDRRAFLAYFKIRIAVGALEFVMQSGLNGLLVFRFKANFLRQDQDTARTRGISNAREQAGPLLPADPAAADAGTIAPPGVSVLPELPGLPSAQARTGIPGIHG